MSRSCKKAAVLLTRSVDGSLGWLGRCRLEWHLRFCATCRALEGHLAFLRGTARRLGRVPGTAEPSATRPSFGDDLKRALRRQAGPDGD